MRCCFLCSQKHLRDANPRFRGVETRCCQLGYTLFDEKAPWEKTLLDFQPLSTHRRTKQGFFFAFPFPCSFLLPFFQQGTVVSKNVCIFKFHWNSRPSAPSSLQSSPYKALELPDKAPHKAPCKLLNFLGPVSKNVCFELFGPQKAQNTRSLKQGPRKFRANGRLFQRTCVLHLFGPKSAKHTFFESTVHCWKKGRRKKEEGRRKETGEGGSPVSKKQGSAF